MSSLTFDSVLTSNLPISSDTAVLILNKLAPHILPASICDIDELNGPEISLPGVAMDLREDSNKEAVDAVLAELSEIVKPLNITICRYMGGKFDSPSAKICMIASIRPAEIVEKVQVGSIIGWNTSNAIFEAVRDWNREYGITILGVSYARIRIRFDTIPADIDDVICSFYDIAPDLGAYAYGEGEVSDMLNAFGKTGVIELFWL